MWIKIKNNILDILFPLNKLERTVTNTNPSEFLQVVPRAVNSPYPDTVVILQYRHSLVRTAIHLLKYKGNLEATKLLSDILSDRIDYEISKQNINNPIIIPIPISKNKLKERGFNQTERMCKMIQKNKNRNSLDFQYNLLKKIKETKNQTEIKKREARLKNLLGVFSVSNSSIIKDREIIVIDDVTTTGATLKEASRALYQVGAKKVISIVLAH